MLIEGGLEPLQDSFSLVEYGIADESVLCIGSRREDGALIGPGINNTSTVLAGNDTEDTSICGDDGEDEEAPPDYSLINQIRRVSNHDASLAL